MKAKMLMASVTPPPEASFGEDEASDRQAHLQMRNSSLLEPQLHQTMDNRRRRRQTSNEDLVYPVNPNPAKPQKLVFTDYSNSRGVTLISFKTIGGANRQNEIAKAYKVVSKRNSKP